MNCSKSPRVFTTASVAVYACLTVVQWSAPAQAQGMTEAIDGCASIANEKVQQACFDALFRSTLATGQQSTSRPNSQFGLTGRQTDKREPSKGSANTSVIPDNYTNPTNNASAHDEFGAENIKGHVSKERKKSSKETLVANIVSRRKTRDGHFAVTLDNGQVWRETDGSHVIIPKNANNVEIYRGAFGGYKMRFEGLRKVAYVRRLK